MGGLSTLKYLILYSSDGQVFYSVVRVKPTIEPKDWFDSWFERHAAGLCLFGIRRIELKDNGHVHASIDIQEIIQEDDNGKHAIH
jgi:hypothetical protein